MLPEISLNILDIVQNSITANASVIQIIVAKNTREEHLTITIKDNGKGMSKEVLAHVCDPFYTSRTTRKVGLGIPFFKQAAECTGGSFRIDSVLGEGTTIEAVFYDHHIDCMPMGNLTDTMMTLLLGHEEIDFVYCYQIDGDSFTLDTRQIKEILGAVSFEEPEVRTFLKEFLTENQKELDAKFEKK